MKSKEVENTTFKDFCQERNIKFPQEYRQVEPTLDAGYKSTAKYDRGQPELDERAWKLAGQWTEQHFSPYVAGSRVMTEEEVIAQMDLKTSCGYPWSLKFTNKQEMLADVRAKSVIEAYWDQMILPEDQMLPIWTVSQKRELRPKEKVLAHNHRTFTASPIELTCASNRLCLDQNERFYTGHNDTWSCVGMSKFSGGWNLLHNRLDRLPNGYELDETAFDSSLFGEALYGVEDMRWNFFRSSDKTDDNRTRLRKVYDAIVNSIMIMENGELDQKGTGNPSGSGNTVVDNTWVLFRLMAYAWIKLAPPHLRNYKSFMEHVEAALYGDDVAYTCSDEAATFYTPENISRVWTSIGVVTRSPCMTPRKACQLSFLSNNFQWEPKLSHWVPVPETDKVLGSLAYGSELTDVRWHFLRACALRMDSYYNHDACLVIDDYINYLNYKYRDHLVGKVEIRPGVHIEMRDIRSLWKPQGWMEQLYTGHESHSDSDVVAYMNKFREVVDISAHQHLLNNSISDKSHLIEHQARVTDNSNKMSGKVTKKVAKAVRKAVNKNKNFKKNVSRFFKKNKKNKPRQINFATRGTRFSDSGQHRFTRPPQARDYVKALTNPFFAPAPKLGFGTFVPTAKHTTWLERGSNISATSTWAVARCVPCVAGALNLYQGTNATLNTPISVPGVFNTTNQSYISLVAQQARVINWGVRIKIRASATALPGTLGLLYIPDETASNIETITPNGFVSLVGYRPCSATSAGQIGGEVQYRPADLVDFEFIADYVLSTPIGSTIKEMQLIAVALGWAPAQWDMEITIIGHLETLAGADAAGETDSEPDLVDGGATIDSVSNLIAQAGEPVRTSLEALQKLDEADSNIRRARYSHSMAGMMRNFASGAVSQDVVSKLEKGEIFSGSSSSSSSVQSPPFNNRQLQDVINSLKEEQDKLLASLAEMRREFALSVKADPIRVHTQTPIPDELSDYEEEKKVSEDIMKQMVDAKAQVVLSRSMFNTLLGK